MSEKSFLFGYWDYKSVDMVFRPVAVVRAKNESKAWKKIKKNREENLKKLETVIKNGVNYEMQLKEIAEIE